MQSSALEDRTYATGRCARSPPNGKSRCSQPLQVFDYSESEQQVNWALLIVRLVLGAVFFTAGLAKLADRPGAVQAMRDFGVPEGLCGFFGTAVPLGELLVAVALIPLASAVAGAIGALVLLLGFSIGIALAMARGEAPDCHCFGQLHSAPAGWRSLIRNLVLAAASAFVIAEGLKEPGASAVAWLARLDGAEAAGLIAGIVVAAAVGGLVWFALQLLHQNGRILLRLDELEAALAGSQGGPKLAPFEWERRAQGLPIGARAPEFNLTAIGGGRRTLESLLAEARPAILVFAEPGCGPCKALLPDVATWQRQHADRLTIAVVARGDMERNQAIADEHSVQNVLVQEDREVVNAYQVHGTPSAVLVSPNRTIASAIAPGAVSIGQLLSRVIQGATTHPHSPLQPAAQVQPPAVPTGLEIGAAMPELTLSDLKGNAYELSSLKGGTSLLLFWNPGCGFCQKMLPDLKAWEADSPEGAPDLVVISTGTPEVVSSMGLSSTVLLDPDGKAAASFGVRGTPMGLLVDSDLRVASPVAAGAPAVFTLAGGHKSAVDATQSVQHNGSGGGH